MCATRFTSIISEWNKILNEWKGRAGLNFIHEESIRHTFAETMTKQLFDHERLSTSLTSARKEKLRRRSGLVENHHFYHTQILFCFKIKRWSVHTLLCQTASASVRDKEFSQKRPSVSCWPAAERETRRVCERNQMREEYSYWIIECFLC